MKLSNTPIKISWVDKNVIVELLNWIRIIDNNIVVVNGMDEMPITVNNDIKCSADFLRRYIIAQRAPSNIK